MPMAPEYDLRFATADDAGTLADHRVGMFRDMGTIEPQQEQALHAAARAYFTRAIPAGEYVSWVACPRGDARTVIAGAGVQLRPMLPRQAGDGRTIITGPEAIVVNMYVEPDWRRRGVARALMTAILEWAPTAGVQRLVLHASKEGRPLYESLGFKATNEMLYSGSLART